MNNLIKLVQILKITKVLKETSAFVKELKIEEGDKILIELPFKTRRNMDGNLYSPDITIKNLSKPELTSKQTKISRFNKILEDTLKFEVLIDDSSY